MKASSVTSSSMLEKSQLNKISNMEIEKKITIQFCFRELWDSLELYFKAIKGQFCILLFNIMWFFRAWWELEVLLVWLVGGSDNKTLI